VSGRFALSPAWSLGSARVVAAIMGVAGGELLIPTIVLLYGIDIKRAGSLSLAISLPTCSWRSPATVATRPSPCYAETRPSSSP
jgi:hypothetical protein